LRRSRKTEVRSYAGQKTGERPLSFVLEGETIEVAEIISRWVEEDQSTRERKRMFKIKGDDGYTYLLSYHESSGDWFLE